MEVERDSTAEQVAGAFAVNRKTVLKWAKAGCPHGRTGSGPKAAYRFNVHEVGAWLEREGRRTTPGRPVAQGAKKGDIERAQLQLTIEKGLTARMRRLKEAGKLHDVTECRQRRLAKVHAVKSTLLGLPRSVSAELAMQSRGEIERILTERLEGILAEFARET